MVRGFLSEPWWFFGVGYEIGCMADPTKGYRRKVRLGFGCLGVAAMRCIFFYRCDDVFLCFTCDCLVSANWPRNRLLRYTIGI